jgi:hypothetical protein
VYKNGGWGFINTENKIQVEPRFLHADIFSNGLAAVQVKDEWGYIDQAGRLVIEPRFLEARRFCDGVAPVKSEKGWLFINKAGIPVEGLSGFEDASGFNDGLAAVKVAGKWRFITESGEKKFDQEFAQATTFSQELAAVQEESNARFGFIDRTGRFVIQPGFENAKPFSEALAAVCLDGRWGYIDASGQLRITNRYPLFAQQFSEGLAVVSDPVRGVPIYINAFGEAQFSKSTRPGNTERGTANSSRCRLISTPPKAQVYLIPLYIWDQGERNDLPPSKLTDTALKDYLNLKADQGVIFRGQTDLDESVLEQNYMAIFRLGDAMRRLRVEVLLVRTNKASVSFEPR